MRMIDIIEKKRDGKSLTKEEIEFFVNGYTHGEVPDYQASSLAMAIFFQDMNDEERAALTMSMVNSGEKIDLSDINGIKVDKHSTGGVGDTTTLVLAPLVAAVGVPVAKMSGRGLGHTGGTIDKLESVKGFNVEISEKDFIKLVNDNQVAVIGQSGNLTPADKKLKEAIATLKGNGPKDLTELVLTLGSQMVVLAEQATSLDEARQMLIDAIKTGKALNKFKTFLSNQGGDDSIVDSPEKLPSAKYQVEFKAKKDGYITEIIANEIGVASMMLGAGRQTKEDVIDLGVGIVLNKKVGEHVEKGENILTIHTNTKEIDDILYKLDNSITIESKGEAPTLIHKIITE